MHIDSLFQIVAQQIAEKPHQAVITVPNNWAQGRTLYGGISASLVYSGMRKIVAPEKLLRSLNTSFIGPIEPDVPLNIKIELLREGKNTSQLQGTITQNDKVCLMALACFGQDRSSKITVSKNDTHNMDKPKKGDFMPMIPKVTPRFLSHFELAKVVGGLPFTGNKKSDVHGWMRLKQAPETFSDSHLVALIDVWPPTVLQMLRWPAPASTMSWNLEFIHPHQPFTPSNWLAYQANTRQAANGYGHTEANIWNEEGDLIAISRQTVTVFD